MTRLIFLLVFTFSTVLIGIAQTTVSGTVYAGEEPAGFVNVVLKGTTFGSLTTDDGKFMFSGVPEGDYTLLINGLGFDLFSKEISVSDSTPFVIDPVLTENGVNLEQVVVSGTLKETFLSDSPVKVEVLTFKFLEKNKTTNLLDAMFSVNGIQKQVDCGVCYTSNLRINGLEGPYTMVLIDGSPIFSNLASVYGLSGIPTASIERIEIIKGPNSTLYGSEAVAGVINVITKKADRQPIVYADFLGTHNGELNLDFAVTGRTKKVNSMLSGNLFMMRNFVDDNNDGFSDIVHGERVSLFNKWSFERPDTKVFDLSVKYYYENRRNGVFDFLNDGAFKNLRGDDTIYGESIFTNRIEFFGTYDLPGSNYFRLNFGGSMHDQDSFYGSDSYVARQYTAFNNFIWNDLFGEQEQFDLTAGVSLRYQNYDDNTQATGDTLNGMFINNTESQFIPGIFVQNEFRFSDKFSVLAGSRLDHYHEHGFILAPRANVKFKPAPYTTFRLNAGTGFRVVQLFTEDHAFVSGNRTVEILEDLKPERSWNMTLNVNQVFNIGKSSGTFDLDGFYTWFSNAIFPDYDTPGSIIYRNTDGRAISRGISASASLNFLFPLSISGGMTFMDVHTIDEEGGERVVAPVEFSPDWSGVFTLSYQFKKIGLSLNYSGQVTGPMELPEVFDVDQAGNLLPDPRPTRSEVFTIQNLQVDKSFKNGFRVYGGIKNLWNWLQDSPLTAVNDPNATPGFSEYFDTSYAYAPIHGREFFFGLSYTLNRKSE
ncbi:MAG: TonB-dependent receptor [Bacteroidota bacterium]